MPRELPLSVVEVKPEPRGTTREAVLAASRLQQALQGFQRVVVARRARGRSTTLRLAQYAEGWMREGGDTAFIIGN